MMRFSEWRRLVSKNSTAPFVELFILTGTSFVWSRWQCSDITSRILMLSVEKARSSHSD